MANDEAGCDDRIRLFRCHGTLRPIRVIASAAKQSIFLFAAAWIASLRSQ
jgi:hypothetical protein